MSDTSNGGRERAYRALAESEELHRATLSSISDAVFLTDDEGLFTFICPNVDVIFGYVPDEVQAMGRIDNLLGEQLFDRAELAARGEIANIEREITSKSRAAPLASDSHQAGRDPAQHHPVHVPRRHRAQARRR